MSWGEKGLGTLFCEEVDVHCIVVWRWIKEARPARGMFAENEDEGDDDEWELGLENKSVYGNLVSLKTTSLEMNTFPLGDKHL